MKQEDQKTINKEQEILAAAEKLFLEKGFALTSTTEIAAIAGCNQAMVHYYFRTKELLFLMIFQEKIKAMFAAMGNMPIENLSFFDLIEKIIGSHFDFIAENPQLPFLIVNELVTKPERIEGVAGGLIGVSADIFNFVTKLLKKMEQAIANGEIRPIALSDFVITMVSLNGGVFTGKTLAMKLMNLDEQGWQKLLVHRREENIRIIINWLKP